MAMQMLNLCVCWLHNLPELFSKTKTKIFVSFVWLFFFLISSFEDFSFKKRLVEWIKPHESERLHFPTADYIHSNDQRSLKHCTKMKWNKNNFINDFDKNLLKAHWRRRKERDRRKDRAENPSKEDGLRLWKYLTRPRLLLDVSLLFCRSHRLSTLCLSDGFEHYYTFLFKKIHFV